MSLFGSGPACRSLRVQTYRYEAGPPPVWRLCMVHVFVGRSQIEALSEERTHRKADVYYREAVEKGAYAGRRYRSRKTWICS